MSDIIEEKASDIEQIYGLLRELSKQDCGTPFVNFYKGKLRQELLDDLHEKYGALSIMFGYGGALSDILRHGHEEIGDAIALRERAEAWNETIRNIKKPIFSKLYAAGASEPNSDASIIEYAKNITDLNKLLNWLSEWNDCIRESTNRYIKTLPSPEDVSLIKHNKPLENIMNTIFERGYVSKKSMREYSESILGKHHIISVDEKDRVFLTNKGLKIYRILHADND